MAVVPARQGQEAARAPKRRPPRRTLSGRRLAGQIVVYTLLIVGSLIFMAPFAWMVVASFKPLGEIFTYPPNWIPHHPTLGNYKAFLQAQDVARWFFNSAFVTLTIVFFQTIFAAMAAYCFAKRRFPLRNGIFLVGLGTMAIPAAVLLVPQYLLLKHIPAFGGNDFLGNGGHGWLDSYWGLIVPNFFNMFSIFMMRQYMRSIPDELIDAAKVDGAGHLRIFAQVIVPLSKPVLAVTAIFAFNFYWNNFQTPLIIISSPDHYTVPLGLALFVSSTQHRTAWDVVMAGSVLAVLPVLIAFVLFQRYIVRGIAISGLK
ncbi:MAG TPA: carbohydrate ABC transporter permease [Gaiellales bacterium]|jgi:multiple sugar transport system permease protein|nr:carbohydrate ABC transporter permease [Gaiellales bacterium]